jgi:hypothetical protein
MELHGYLSRGLAGLSAALVAVVLSAWPALATAPAGQTSPSPQTTQIAVPSPSPETVQAGEKISLSFTGVKPCPAESLTVRWAGKPLAVDNVVAGAAGSDSFTADATVPTSQAGLYEVDAGCTVGVHYVAEVRGSVYVVTLVPSAPLVQAGKPVTISGSGFTQCTDPAGSTTVDLSAAGTLLATASGASFQQGITVPVATSAGPYLVTAQCSAQPGIILASTNVSVVTLALSPVSATPGMTISATGSGFAQCDEVQLQLLRDATPTGPAGSPIVPANGGFTAGVTVPPSAAPGTDYQVEAGCHSATGSNASIAGDQLTVTPAGPPATPPTSPASPPTSPASPTSPTSASSTTPSSARSAGGSPSSTSATARLGPTSPSSPSSPLPSPAPSGQPSGRASGLLQPVALVGGTSAGLALVALLLVRALSMVHGRRGRGWVNKHLRVAAGWARPLSARVERRRGATSVSVGLEPHFDGLRNPQNEEAAR